MNQVLEGLGEFNSEQVSALTRQLERCFLEAGELKPLFYAGFEIIGIEKAEQQPGLYKVYYSVEIIRNGVFAGPERRSSVHAKFHVCTNTVENVEVVHWS